MLYTLGSMADPTGRMRFNGNHKPISRRQLAGGAGCDVKDASRYLHAAVAAGVLDEEGERANGSVPRYVLVVTAQPDWDAAARVLAGSKRDRRRDQPWQASPERPAGERCRAKTRAGQPCRGWAVPGTELCSTHGGCDPRQDDADESNQGGTPPSVPDSDQGGTPPQVYGDSETEPGGYAPPPPQGVRPPRYQGGTPPHHSRKGFQESFQGSLDEGGIAEVSQSVETAAQRNEASRYLRDRYGDGLTDQVISAVFKVAHDRAQRAGKPVRSLKRYLESWAEGDLADVVGAALDTEDRRTRPPETDTPDLTVVNPPPSSRRARQEAISTCTLCDHNGLTHEDRPRRCDHQQPDRPLQPPILAAVPDQPQPRSQEIEDLLAPIRANARRKAQ